MMQIQNFFLKQTIQNKVQKVSMKKIVVIIVNYLKKE